MMHGPKRQLATHRGTGTATVVVSDADAPMPIPMIPAAKSSTLSPPAPAPSSSTSPSASSRRFRKQALTPDHGADAEASGGSNSGGTYTCRVDGEAGAQYYYVAVFRTEDPFPHVHGARTILQRVATSSEDFAGSALDVLALRDRDGSASVRVERTLSGHTKAAVPLRLGRFSGADVLRLTLGPEVRPKLLAHYVYSSPASSATTPTTMTATNAAPALRKASDEGDVDVPDVSGESGERAHKVERPVRVVLPPTESESLALREILVLVTREGDGNGAHAPVGTISVVAGGEDRRALLKTDGIIATFATLDGANENADSDTTPSSRAAGRAYAIPLEGVTLSARGEQRSGDLPRVVMRLTPGKYHIQTLTLCESRACTSPPCASTTAVPKSGVLPPAVAAALHAHAHAHAAAAARQDAVVGCPSSKVEEGEGDGDAASNRTDASSTARSATGFSGGGGGGGTHNTLFRTIILAALVGAFVVCAVAIVSCAYAIPPVCPLGTLLFDASPGSDDGDVLEQSGIFVASIGVLMLVYITCRC